MRGVCGAEERRGAARLRNETRVAVGLRARSMGLVKACRQLGQTRRLAHRFLEDDHIAGHSFQTLEDKHTGEGRVSIDSGEGW